MKKSIWIPTALSAAMLAACGGGGSSDSTGPGALATTLSVSGVAATGAAIGGKTVEAKCVGGSGSATSGSDGSFTISVSAGGSLPCVLKVTTNDGSALFSVAAGSGNAAVANISPVTQLVIASLSGGDPATYFGAFDSTAAAAVTSSSLGDAVSAVKATLLAAGLDLTAIDVLGGTLTPATGTTTGNAYDQALDALAAKLNSSGTTLSTLATTVAAASPTATTATTTQVANVASLPADLLLKPAAATCAALRSGKYRVFVPAPGLPLAEQYGTIEMNAATLAVTYGDGSTSVWAPHPTDACRFSNDNGRTDITVSPAGVVVSRDTNDNRGTTTYHLTIAVPLQNHTLAELAGKWNIMGLQYDSTSASYYGSAVSATLGADGTVSDVSVCESTGTWNVASCVAKATELPSVRANADGGFEMVDAGSTVASGRSFAYRAGSGDLMVINVDADGSVELRTRQRNNELPAVGRVATSWDLRVTNQLLTTPLVSSSTNTVTAVDTTAGSFTRRAKTVGGTDEHLETVLVNSPRNGYNFRAAANVLGTDGVTLVNVAEWTNLVLRGMGMNALVRPAQKQLMLSVQQPG